MSAILQHDSLIVLNTGDISEYETTMFQSNISKVILFGSKKMAFISPTPRPATGDTNVTYPAVVIFEKFISYLPNSPVFFPEAWWLEYKAVDYYQSIL